MIFVSHKGADTDWSERLATRLRAAGLEVWLDKWEIRPGDSITGRIDEALGRATVLLLVLTPEAVGPTARWVSHELRSLLASRLSGAEATLVPLLVRDTEIPMCLRDIKHVDFRDPERFEQELAGLLDFLLGRDPKPPLGTTYRRQAGAFYGSTADVPAKVVFAHLLDTGARLLIDVRSTGYDLSQKRRALALGGRLLDRAQAMLPRLSGELRLSTGARAAAFFSQAARHYRDLLDEWLGATGRASAQAHGMLRDAKYRVEEEAGAVVAELGLDPAVTAGLADLEQSPLRFALQGFASEAEHREWLHPSTRSLLAGGDPGERLLLETLLARKRVVDEELVADGFPEPLVTGVLNCMLRDKWLRHVEHAGRAATVELKRVGERLLAQLLAGPGTAAGGR
jgi:hypothetical protein